MSKITEGGLSRRQFLTGSALTAGAVASLGLAGCAPKAPTEAPATGESDLAATGADGTTVRAHAAQLNPQSDPKPVSNTTCPSLFTEWKMGPLTLPNRVVKSAAGYIGVTSQGITGDLHMQHYGKLAAGGQLPVVLHVQVASDALRGDADIAGSRFHHAVGQGERAHLPLGKQ